VYNPGQFFKSEPAADDHVWRYMDFARFVSLLDSRTLFFGSAKIMRDPWEGAFGSGSSVDPGYLQYLEQMQTREMMYMSCWSVGEVESAGLWDLYQSGSMGVALKSTWGRLTSSLRTRRYIVGGAIEYIDHASTEIDPSNIFNTYVYKRRQFEYEREARLLHWAGAEREGSDQLRDGEVKSIPLSELIRPGIPIKVDLETLVESVYVAPNAQPWVAELVKSVIAKYGHDFEVFESTLYAKP
jgi:hypothetical protein